MPATQNRILQRVSSQALDPPRILGLPSDAGAAGVYVTPSGVTENIRAPLQSQACGPKPDLTKGSFFLNLTSEFKEKLNNKQGRNQIFIQAGSGGQCMSKMYRTELAIKSVRSEGAEHLNAALLREQQQQQSDILQESLERLPTLKVPTANICNITINGVQNVTKKEMSLLQSDIP
ncbi:hypothetical protein TNCV_4061071 [Trichonephila clavipes]|nr:hypothetical protein TNCV_4061071 [Trichonephila clavipes]